MPGEGAVITLWCRNTVCLRPFLQVNLYNMTPNYRLDKQSRSTLLWQLSTLRLWYATTEEENLFKAINHPSLFTTSVDSMKAVHNILQWRIGCSPGRGPICYLWCIVSCIFFPLERKTFSSVQCVPWLRRWKLQRFNRYLRGWWWWQRVVCVVARGNRRGSPSWDPHCL